MAINVARSFSQAVTETVQQRYFLGENDILLNPELSPLLAMTTRAKRRMACFEPKIEWVEDDYIGVWGQVAEGADKSSVATTVTVTDATIFATGDLVAVPKAVSSNAAPEVVRVTGIAGSVLTITRNIGSAGADTIGSSGALRILGPAIGEGAAVPGERTTSKSVKNSFTQIFRTPVSVTKSMAASRQYGARNERRFQQNKKLQEHKRYIENAGFFSRAAGNDPRSTMGLRSIISTNVTDGSTTLTESAFLTFAEGAFDDYFAGRMKAFFAAPKIVSALGFWSNNNLQYGPEEEVLGVSVQRYKSNHGDLIIVRDLELQQGIASQNGFHHLAFAVDLDSVEFGYLSDNGENRDTQLLQDVKKDGTDAFVDEWLTEGGWSFKFEKRHALLFNVTAYS